MPFVIVFIVFIILANPAIGLSLLILAFLIDYFLVKGKPPTTQQPYNDPFKDVD